MITIPHRLPALDGLRAVAALGIIVTHVSFQTGTGWGIAERFDYFVAVFFALSAFVLWRRRDHLEPRSYYLKRALRILPAYLVCVVTVIMLLPDAHFITGQQILANLTLTQVYFPDGLAPGLTHLWSLCIEVAFYVVLPFLRGGPRVIAGAAVLSLGWAFLPPVADYDGGINSQIWPPAYTLWFAVGMLAAEFEGRVPRWLDRAFRVRWVWWLVALAMTWLGSRGTRGLAHPDPAEFALRVTIGGVFAAAVVVPYALAPPGPDHWLNSEPMQALGRWSYSIFLWHVAVLSVVFPVLGVNLFSGLTIDFITVLAATVALTIPVAALSYEVVEEPALRWRPRITRWLTRNRPHSLPTATEHATRTPQPGRPSPR